MSFSPELPNEIPDYFVLSSTDLEPALPASVQPNAVEDLISDPNQPEPQNNWLTKFNPRRVVAIWHSRKRGATVDDTTLAANESRRAFITFGRTKPHEPTVPDKDPDLDAIANGVTLFLNTKITRRTGLVGAATLGAGAVVAGAELYAIRQDWQASQQSNDTFLKENAELLDHVQLGVSFAPEKFSDPEEALAKLKVVVETLGFKDIRFGLRWPNYARYDTPEPDFTFSYYKPFLDYLLKECPENVKLCLNTGIKVFGWPETYLAVGITDALDEMPHPKGIVNANAPLAHASIASLRACLEFLKINYTKEQRARISHLMHENEPRNGFGETYKWTMSKEYLKKAYHVIGEYFDDFPNAKIVVNSAGRMNLQENFEMLVELQAEDERFKGRQSSGYNFYYALPARDYWPRKYFDNSYSLNPFLKSCEANVTDNTVASIETEATEVQMEPWGYIKQPGNSAEHLRFVLLRTAKRVLQVQNHPQSRVARLWGIELFVNNLLSNPTADHLAMAQLMQTLNFIDRTAV